MTLSLRPLARSPRLRAMGMLAWLMLVINSLAAAPMGMSGMPQSHPMRTTVAAVSEPCHHPVAARMSRSCCGDQAGCCDGMAGHACTCTALCNTTLPPAAGGVLTAVALTASYAMPLPVSAPSLNTSPPLRPPEI